MTEGSAEGRAPKPNTQPAYPRVAELLSGPRALVALALLQVAIALLVWEPFPAGVWHDDGVYLLLGRALAEGEGLRYHGVAGAYPAPKFPPVYPGVLAGLWLLLSDVGAVTLAAGVLNLAFLVGGCLLFFHLLRTSLGMGAAGAAGLAALAWAPFPVWRSALVPFSEPLFLLLLTLALLLACRFERNAAEAPVPSAGGDAGSAAADGWPWRRPREGLIWAGLVLALLAAIHVRTVGVALVAAVVMILWAQRRRRTAWITLGAVGAGMLPWVAWSSRANGQIPEVLRDVLGSYGSWLVEQVIAYPDAYVAGLHVRALDILDRVLTILLPAPSTWEPWVDDFRIVALVFFIPAILLGFDRIWARSRILVLFLFFYLFIIWLWPFQATRLLVPLVPVLLLVVTAGFLWSKEDRGTEGEEAVQVEEDPYPERPTEPISPKVVRGWRGVGVVWIVLFSVATAWNLGTGWAGAGFRINAGALARTVQAVDEATPRDAVVGAPEFWAAIPLHSGRTSAPSARFLPVRSGGADGPSWGTPVEQHRIWGLTGIDHLVLEQRGSIHGEALDELVETCGPAAVQNLASWPEGRLVRLGWDAECRTRLGIPREATTRARR